MVKLVRKRWLVRGRIHGVLRPGIKKSNVREEANGFLANTVFVERTQKGVMKLECEGPVLCEGQGLQIGYLLWQIKKLK